MNCCVVFLSIFVKQINLYNECMYCDIIYFFSKIWPLFFHTGKLPDGVSPLVLGGQALWTHISEGYEIKPS